MKPFLMRKLRSRAVSQVVDLEYLIKNFKQHQIDNHDVDILESLLSFTGYREDAKILSNELVGKFSSLRRILDASVDELCSLDCIKEDVVFFLKFVKLTLCAYLNEHIGNKKIIHCYKDIITLLTVTFSDEKVENFIAIYLNAKNEVLGIEKLCEGTLDHVVVYPRKVIELAFKYNARSVIFAHNHPSGDPMPSQADLRLTRDLQAAAMGVDILVLDHIIIGRNFFFSAQENGLIATDKKGFCLEALNLFHAAEIPFPPGAIGANTEDTA